MVTQWRWATWLVSLVVLGSSGHVVERSSGWTTTRLPGYLTTGPTNLQLRDSAGLHLHRCWCVAPASPLGPDHPGNRAPTLHEYSIVRPVYRFPVSDVKRRV